MRSCSHPFRGETYALPAPAGSAIFAPAAGAAADHATVAAVVATWRAAAPSVTSPGQPSIDAATTPTAVTAAVAPAPSVPPRDAITSTIAITNAAVTAVAAPPSAFALPPRTSIPTISIAHDTSASSAADPFTTQQIDRSGGRLYH